MRALTIILADPAPARVRAALTLACAQAALGAPVTLFAHEAAAASLIPGDDGDAAALVAAGLPDRAALLAMAREGGVRLIACQTGLAMAGLTADALPAGTKTGGMIGVLGLLGDARLVVV